MKRRRKNISYNKAKANFTRKAYSTAATAVMLLGINLFTYSGFMWAFIPIFFMGIGLIRQYGDLKARRYEEPVSRRKDFRVYDDELELKQFEDRKSWKEADLVRGNSYYD